MIKSDKKNTKKSVPTDVNSLNSELETVILDFVDYHNEMYKQQLYYENSAVYAAKSGEKKRGELKVNFLETFADKNIDYTAALPGFKVPISPIAEEREAANKREKIIHSVHRASGSEINHEKWMFDATIRSVMISETYTDYKNRCVKVKRYDPRFCFWQKSNDNDLSISKFWAVYPITKTEAKDKYGVEPTALGLDIHRLNHPSLTRLDGQDWFLLAIRWTGKTRTAWVGDKIVEEEFNHMQPFMPIDMAFPFTSGSSDGRGKFYLNKLIPLQAEYNEALQQRSSIVRRMANPLVWARGVIGKQIDEVKRGIEKQSGGFMALKSNGDLGVLNVPETRMIDSHMADMILQMLRLSGFGLAAFGESVGANTSGDALGMYFSPTERAIKRQNIHHKAFYESINAKILMAYESMAKNDQEEFKITGLAPASTVITTDDDGNQVYTRSSGIYNETFTKADIGGNYVNIVIPVPVTPKDDMANKKFWMEAVNAGFASRLTGYEEIGLLSPQDELKQLEQEQSNPALNSKGIADLMRAQPNQGVLPTETSAEIGSGLDVGGTDDSEYTQ